MSAIKFIIYSKSDCPWCEKAKKLLDSYNFPYEEKVLNIDYTKEELAKLLPENTKITVPQIFRGDQYIGGYDTLLGYFEQHGIFGLQQ